MNRVIRVDERSQVAEARREAVRLGQSVALDATSIDQLALTCTDAERPAARVEVAATVAR